MNKVDLLVTVVLMVNLLLAILLVIISKRLLRLREENNHLRQTMKFVSNELGAMDTISHLRNSDRGSDSLFKDINGALAQVGGGHLYRSGGYQPYSRPGFKSPGNPLKDI